MTELVLVSHVLCPYVQRVAITLHEKGAAFQRVDVDRPVETGIEGEGHDHTTTTLGPAFSMSSASSGSRPLSVITVSMALSGATRAKSSRPNFE